MRKRRIKDVIVIEKSIGEDAKNSNFINTERTGNKKGSVTAKTKLLEGVSPSSEAKKDMNILINIKIITAQSNLSTVTAVILKMVFIHVMMQSDRLQKQILTNDLHLCPFLP